MSSSAISQAELEAQKRAELERQRQERLRKIRVATDRYNSIVDRLDAFCIKLTHSMINELQTFDSNDELSFACNSFRAVKLFVTKEIRELLEKSPIPTEAEDIQALSNRLEMHIPTFENKYNKGLSEFSNRLETYSKGKAELAKNRELGNALVKIEKEKRIDFSNANFNFSDLLHESSNEDTDIDSNEIISECLLLINNNAISKTDKRKLITIVNELRDTNGGTAVVHQYRALKGSILNNIRLFNSLYDRYTALHIEKKEMEKSKQTVIAPLLPRDSFDSLEDLEDEVKRLNEETRRDFERQYIRRQIDEVMQGHGFNISESFVMEGITKGQNLLLESDDRAVHVYMSDKGSVMFEPIGLDGLDESGNDGYDGKLAERMSDAEREAIYQDQIEFCKFFPGVVEELKKRGVILNDTKYPDADMNDAKLIKVKGKRSKRRKSESDDEASRRLRLSGNIERALK